MNYLERKELLESQGWYCMVKVENRATFTKDDLFRLYIEVDCTNGDYTVWSDLAQNDLEKYMPILERN